MSCYDGKDSGDNWKVECLTSGDKTWIRENTIQLVHEDTYSYLSSSANHQFGHPIPGQLEVATSRSSSKNSQWIAQVITIKDTLVLNFIIIIFLYIIQEGVYFAATSKQ